MIDFSGGFLLANNQVSRVLIGYNRQLLLIKIHAGISIIFKKVHHLLKLRASNKGIKQMLFLLFLNFFILSYFHENVYSDQRFLLVYIS